MYEIIYTGQFRRSLKLCARRGLDIQEFTASKTGSLFYGWYLDEKLNDHGYIVPGLGDAGDRIFGTK